MQWYYSFSGQQIGPVSAKDLQNLARDGTIQPETQVWRSGLANWMPASQVTELELTFSGIPPPISSMASGGMAGPAYQESPVSNTGPFAASILTTLLCMPLGIPSIVFAAKIRGKNEKGDFKGAKKASKSAYLWSGIALGVGVVLMPIVGLLAAMAIPAFNRVRTVARQTTLINDGRMIGNSAQQYFLSTGKEKVSFAYDPATGTISGDLTPWLKQIGKNYTVHDNTIESGESEAFSLSLLGAFEGKPVQFDDEGKTEKDPNESYRSR